jgi:hypothetical protein
MVGCAECGAFEACQAPNMKCEVVKCEAKNVAKGLDPIVRLPCPSVCWPTKPLMVNASFSNDGTSIQVI